MQRHTISSLVLIIAGFLFLEWLDSMLVVEEEDASLAVVVSGADAEVEAVSFILRNCGQ